MSKHSSIFNAFHKPPKWEIFNMPLKTNIRYSIIFNDTRDFQQSIEKHAIEVPNWSKMSSCCIVDNSVNRQQMDVIFLDEYECCSCLGLRLFIQKQLLSKRSNSLLVFLNKLKRGGTYKFQNTVIYIKCTASLKWSLFYDLFEFLVKRLGRSVIGLQFYIHFVCNDLISKELCFLQNTKGKQDFGNIIPIVNGYQTKKIEVSEITMSGRQFGLKVCSQYKSKVSDCKIQAHKRKNIDTNPVDKYKLFKSNLNRSKKICCNCEENKWQCFKPFVKYIAHSYTNILEGKGVLKKLEITHSSVDSCIYSSTVPKVASAGAEEINFIPGSLVITTMTPSNITKEISLRWKPYHIVPKAINNIDTHFIERVESRDVRNNESVINKENTDPKNNKDTLQHSLNPLGNNQSSDSELFSGNFDNAKGVIKQEDMNAPNILCENLTFNQMDRSFMMFQTASGKALKISEKSLQIAQKMYSEVCSQVIDTTKNEEDSSFANLQEKAKHCDYKHNSCFSSASKSTLSKTCLDNNMDTALDDRFFEEISFDEKEMDCKPENQPGQSTSISSSISSRSQSRKVKKSLGGRRNLKPYTKKIL